MVRQVILLFVNFSVLFDFINFVYYLIKIVKAGVTDWLS